MAVLTPWTNAFKCCEQYLCKSLHIRRFGVYSCLHIALKERCHVMHSILNVDLRVLPKHSLPLADIDASIQPLSYRNQELPRVPLVCHLRCPSSFPSSPVPFSNHGYRENADAWKRRHDMRINHYTGIVVIMQLCFCCALRTAMLRKAIKINFQPLNPWESLLILNCVVL